MVRVRIAPSPTGEPHLGNLRTAIYNWLFARQQGGKFIVRIEDTDRERYVPGSQNAILEGLRWLGLDYDEGPGIGGPYGPYVQSERRELYGKSARELVEKGAAYYCFCSKERLEKMRRDQEQHHEPSRYDRLCRNLSAEEVDKRMKQGEVPVIRLKVPESGKTGWRDLIHGRVEFLNSAIDDQVLLKSDGFPTYQLAVVIDDHLMKISHILRADEWMSSTPKHLLLFQAFGWDIPFLGHLPMVLGPDHQKLSKRHGATSVLAFRDLGYLPEAVLNYLALLGWSYNETEEIFSREELINKFSLEKINPTNPIFDRTKLDWLNGLYIRRLPPAELGDKLKSFDSKWREVNPETLNCVLPLVRERIKNLAEFEPMAGFFFNESINQSAGLLPSGEAERDLIKPQMDESFKALAELKTWREPEIEAAIRKLSLDNDWKHGQYFMVLRLVITGQKISPPLFSTMAILGREKTLARLKVAA